MSSSFQLQPVIEFYYVDGESPCPWEVTENSGFTWIRISAEMTQPEIGAFFSLLARYKQIERSSNRSEILQVIIAAESLALDGGIQAVFEEQVISPSCCCTLREWREWQDFLQTGQTPWLGHDPSPWLEQVDDVIRIWSDGGLGHSTENAFKIEVPRPEFERALQVVEQDLLGFLCCVESWCESLGFEQAGELVEKVEQCFNIGQRHL
jgi:hypothetical protein